MSVIRTWQIMSCAALSLVPSATQAYCPGTDEHSPRYDPHYYSVANEFARSKYVVVGSMYRETWLGEDGKPKRLKGPFQSGAKRPWGFDPYAGVYYEVRVQRSLKGAAPRHLRLFSENSTARFWLRRGVGDLLFITFSRFDPPMQDQLTIDNCGNSAEVAGHRSLLQRARRLAANSTFGPK